MNESNSVLTRFFSQNTLNSFFTEQEYSSHLIEVIIRKYSIPTDDNSTNEAVISEIYKYIGNEYRNEYFYKNTLLNKLLINVHRINTTTALTEVPISKSKADFIMINGKAVVYEIKTELDTFERLSSQINDYYKAFDHVCVVTSQSKLESLSIKLEQTPVGIYILTDCNTIKRIKEPSEYKDMLDTECIFKILNKSEYENVILQLAGFLPETTQAKYYSACKSIFCKFDIDKLYPLFLKELKKRNRIYKYDYKSIPEALHFLIYFSKVKKADTKILYNYLSQKYKGGLES